MAGTGTGARTAGVATGGTGRGRTGAEEVSDGAISRLCSDLRGAGRVQPDNIGAGGVAGFAFLTAGAGEGAVPIRRGGKRFSGGKALSATNRGRSTGFASSRASADADISAHSGQVAGASLCDGVDQNA